MREQCLCYVSRLIKINEINNNLFMYLRYQEAFP